MKVSKKPTGQILIKAQVCSEWDFCNSCLIEFGEEDIKRWNAYDMLATSLKQKSEFHCLAIWEGSTFLNLDEEKIEIPDYWCYVKVKDLNDTKECPRPEQNIDANQIKFYGEGMVCFIGYGKHTSEEFWSETININELTNKVYG